MAFLRQPKQHNTLRTMIETAGVLVKLALYYQNYDEFIAITLIVYLLNQNNEIKKL